MRNTLGLPARRLTTVALLATLLAGLYLPAPTRAASPEPALPPGLTLTAEPLLGGSFRAGTWMAVRAMLKNDGPAIAGELRLVNTLAGGPTYSVTVELPTGARQEHVIYGEIQAIIDRYRIELWSGSSLLVRSSLTFDTRHSRGPRTYVVSDRPERLIGAVNDALDAAGHAEPVVVGIRPDELPPRVQAWSSIELLVWQDADSRALDGERVDALRTWLTTGGQLMILGGSTGLTTFGGFPAELLPYAPEGTVDVQPSDLAVFGEVPAEASALPAVAGSALSGDGTLLLASGSGSLIAARRPVGRGAVTLVGFDPTTPWLAGSSLGQTVWARLLPTTQGVAAGSADDRDSFIVFALGDLPSVGLPDLLVLLALLGAYVLAIGPLNYFVLRRRDRRELAWLTMPLTIGVFALGAYLLGVTTHGSDVVINELAIVRSAAGAERGLADVYVGVFSPGRASYDVAVSGKALVSTPLANEFGATSTRAIDVLQGEPSTIRRFGVSFGSLRAFTAQAAVAVPRIDADLRLEGDALLGSVVNSSAEPLSAVSVVFGQRVLHLGDLAPGESRPIDLRADARNDFREISLRLVPDPASDDPEALRATAARRALIDHLQGGWRAEGRLSGELSSSGPTIVAFSSVAPLDVSVGGSAERVGETLYLMPAQVGVVGQVSMAGSLVQRTVTESEEFFEDGGSFYVTTGTLTVEYRPAGLSGTFRPTELALRLASAPGTPATANEELLPLPAEEQPASDAPLSANPRPGASASLPRVQLFDLTAQEWVEFEPLQSGRTYRIAEPTRWLDAAGTLRVRFVIRGMLEAGFSLDPRISGTVE